MKCVCGYENRSGEWDADNLELIKDNHEPKFILIAGRFDPVESLYEDSKKIKLIMCPKCGTIKGQTV